MVVYDNAEVLDVTGPLDVFATANQLVMDLAAQGPSTGSKSRPHKRMLR